MRDRVLRSLASGDGLALLVDCSDGLGGMAQPSWLAARRSCGVRNSAASFGNAFLYSAKLVVPQLLQTLALGARIPMLHKHAQGSRTEDISSRYARGLRNFVSAQRCAVHVVGARLVGRTNADDSLQQISEGLSVTSWLLRLRRDRFRVMALDVAHHVPAVGLQNVRCVVGIPAVDGDRRWKYCYRPRRLSACPAPSAGQRAGFVRDAFHHATVAHEDPGTMVDDLVAGLVEFVSQQLFRHRHTDGIGDALTQRAGSGLNAKRCSRIRGGPGLGVHLTEALQFFDRQIVAGQVQTARRPAWSRARWTARSGRGLPISDWPDCGAGDGSTGLRRFLPCP